MATSIPPHNFKEVVDACVALIDNPEGGLTEVLKHVRGPDFPTGGQLLSSKRELREVYETGQGSLKLRAEWKLEEPKKKGNPSIIITSIPYAVERKTIVEKIAEVIISKKLPRAARRARREHRRVPRGVRDQGGHRPAAGHGVPVQAHAARHQRAGQPDLPRARRGQRRRRAAAPRPGQHPQALPRLPHGGREEAARVRPRAAQGRIHILEGFEKIFDVLDETIAIIRKSEGKQDAAQKLMKRFALDEEQVDAILELKLYRLAKLEILVIQKELDEKRDRGRRAPRSC